jgi:peptidoglycan/xylan/chitin deacetylase (PgdA/CDA1 family)
MIPALLGAAAVGAGIYVGVPAAAKIQLRRHWLRRIERSGAICLTFDDGPDADSTPAILSTLGTYGARATFFLVGRKVKARSDIVAQIIEAGHEVGTHGYWHTFAWRTDPIRSALDVIRGRRALQEVSGGAPCRWFRPPYGKLNAASLISAWTGRQELAFWNVDPCDYLADSGERIAGYVRDRLGPGAVVLLHDGSMRPDNNWRVRVDAVTRVLDGAAARGLVFSTLSDALPSQVSGRAAARRS